MRILLANKYYYLRSGAERYLFNLTRLLEEKGHTVAVFSMHHPRNQPTPWSKYFLPPIEYRGRLNFVQQLYAALRSIWYPRAGYQIERMINEFRPDIVQIHNLYHHISPSILPVIRQHGIPIVHRLHDYKLICPNYLLRTQGQVCEQCKDQRYLRAVRLRCLHGSLSWSLVAAVEMTIHKKMRVYERHVARFSCPGQFQALKMGEFGIPANSLVHLPNFLFLDDVPLATPPPIGSYALYLGRLTGEKGLWTLLEASCITPIPLRILGEGPMYGDLHRAIQERQLGQVEMLGYQQGEELARSIDNARFLVVPSEYYEVFGQIIMEAFSRGKPVIATNIGGIPEVVSQARDGLLIPPGQPEALAQAMRWLWERPQDAAEMGRNGRDKVARQYSAEVHYQNLMQLYRDVLS